MTNRLIAALIVLVNSIVFTQNAAAQFERRISAFTWMPDGNAVILNVLNVDKTEKTPPVARKIKFNIQSGALDFLPIDGGGLAVSPNGNSVAYIKQVNGKDQIYLYNIALKEDKPLVKDTLKKYALNWSHDGNYLVYNIQTGKGAGAKVEICTYNIQTDAIKQITQNSAFKCYTPAWNTKNDKIVYTAEKGDKRDQIYLTDKNGSFHTNLTNDTTTHNYSPYWLNEKTIIYIQSPGYIMTFKIDANQVQRIDEINTTQFKYNSTTNKIIYLDADGKLMLFDLKNKTKEVLIHQNELNQKFNESDFKE